MTARPAPRSLRALTTLGSWAAVAAALASLPADEAPIGWLAAFVLPLAAFAAVRWTSARAWLFAITVQLGACLLAYELVGPLSRPAALACTILPPMSFVAVRRLLPSDGALALFLAFCTVLVGSILGGPSPWLLAAFVAAGALVLRCDARLAVLAATHSAADVATPGASRGSTARQLLRGLALAAACGICAFAAANVLALLPSPSRGDSGAPSPLPDALRDAARALGVSEQFRLDGGEGRLLAGDGSDLVRVRRLGRGRAVPGDLYLRTAFFAVPGLDEWKVGPVEPEPVAAGAPWSLRAPDPLSPITWFTVERLGGPRVFVPVGAHEVRGLEEGLGDPVREWRRQTGPGRAPYEVAWQPQHVPGPDAVLDPRARAMGLYELPRGLDRAPFRALLDEWGARGDALTIGRRVAEGLASRCTYDRVEPRGPHPHALLNFLFGPDRRGYCMHFASAAAILLRVAGVPCRIGVGVHGGAGDGADARLYGSEHAHAWVEVPVKDRGFLVFDPTPPAERGHDAARVPGVQAADPPEPIELPEQDPEAEGELDGAAAAGSRPWLAFALLLAFLGIAAWPGRRPASREAPLPPEPRTARRLLGKVLAALGAAGVRRARGETLEQFARSLAATPLWSPAFGAAFAAYQEVRFGGRPLDAERETRLRAAVDAARALPPQR